MKLSREVIYAALAIVVVTALLCPMGLTPTVSGDAHRLYNFIEALPPRSIVWMGFDYYASTSAECEPNARALLSHLFRKDLRVVMTEDIPDSAAISTRISTDIARQFGKQYGTDYVNLGFQAGDKMFIKQVSENFHATFPKDHAGHPIDSLPLMEEVHTARDVVLVLTITDNNTFDYFVQNVHTEFKTPVAGAMTAVMVPNAAVYLNSGQAMAVLGGLRGAAEYELLMGVKGMGTSGLDAQSCAHVFIVLLIIVSNIEYFRSRRTSL